MLPARHVREDRDGLLSPSTTRKPITSQIDLSQLDESEIASIQSVMERNLKFENTEKRQILEATERYELLRRSRSPSPDTLSTLCHFCEKNPARQTCKDCSQRGCKHCLKKANRVCKICCERRRLLTISGQWFQGTMTEATNETLTQLSQLTRVAVKDGKTSWPLHCIQSNDMKRELQIRVTYQRVSEQLVLTVVKGRNLEWDGQYNQLYVVVCLLDELSRVQEISQTKSSSDVLCPVWSHYVVWTLRSLDQSSVAIMLWGQNASDHLCGLLVIDLTDHVTSGEAKWHTLIDDPHAMLSRAPLGSSSSSVRLHDKTNTQTSQIKSMCSVAALNDDDCDSLQTEASGIDLGVGFQSEPCHSKAQREGCKSGCQFCSTLSSCASYDSSDSCSLGSQVAIVVPTLRVGELVKMTETDKLGPGQLLTINGLTMSGSLVVGELHLTLSQHGSVLKVLLSTGRRLVSVYGNTSWPCVRLSVRGRRGKVLKQTSQVVESWDPQFNNTFVFSLSSSHSKLLQVSALASCDEPKCNTLLGETLIALNSLELCRRTISGWYKLFPLPCKI